MADREGQRCGDYRLIHVLGKGGFSEVYLGEHIHLHTQVAVKILNTQLTSPADVRSFLNEARTFRLKHPHIAQVLDFGVGQDDTPFLIIDYAPNGTLRKRHPKGTRVPLETIVSYIEQIAPALQYAHDQKLIHRDIKPENILIGRNNEVLLSDFGIAIVVQSARTISQGGGGTPPYMAPEQVKSRPVQASDQYALGIIVYEWLCGAPPFEGAFWEVLNKHLSVPPPPLREKVPTISPDVEYVVMKALEKDPKQRFANVQAFANALRQALNPEPQPPTERLLLSEIRFLTGPLAGSTFPVSKPMITIGREAGHDIVIFDPSVSRRHAEIALSNGLWTINKIAPQNTVSVNSRDVQQTILNDRDTVGLGATTTFVFLVKDKPAQVAPETERIDSDKHGVEANEATPKMGIPALEISSTINPVRQKYSLSKQVINIGRDDLNDIVIRDKVVSHFHAQIVREGDHLILIHPHPSRPQTLNGLLYQGRHILGTEAFRKPLVRGDIFRIGDEHGTLVTLIFDDGSGASLETVPQIRPIPLGAPVITIGRLPPPVNVVVLNHPQVSGRHAELRQEQGGYRIIDLGSTNHVYVNAQRVTNQLLRPGDEVRIGPFMLIYTGTQLTQYDESSSIRIDALHLRKVSNNQAILLNDISLAILPRKFVAILGVAGSGKSILLDALSGLRPAQQGVVLFNGQDYYRHLPAFSTQVGYVPQDDIIHGDLTVECALYYAARMHLPEDFTEAQIRQRIDEVLEEVEMKDMRRLLIKKLSREQRKRISIALELLPNPSVFFLDEPTSGFDPDMDRRMMLFLRKLADKGHTVALVTHATNNINACDYICFLTYGGRLAYYGPPNEAKSFFGKTDFTEIYSILKPDNRNPNAPVEAEAKFKSSSDYMKYVVEPLNQGPAGRANVQQQNMEIKPSKRGNPWMQFWLLSMRYLELLKNDKSHLFILLLQAPIIALILLLLAGPGTFDTSSVVQCNPSQPGLPTIPVTVPNGNKYDCQNVVNAIDTPQGQALLLQKNLTRQQAIDAYIVPASGGDAQKILFIMALAAVLCGCINGIREIAGETPIYTRERTVNLGIVPYLSSKIAVLGVLCLLQSAVLVFVVNVKAPFHQSTFLPPPLEIYSTMVLTSLAGLMIGLLISAIAPNNDRATSLIPLILIPQLIFSGIIFALNNPLLQFLGAFFVARWAMAGMGSTVGLHGDKLGADDFSFQGTLFSPFTRAEATVHLFIVWFALIVMIVVLVGAVAYFLKQKDARSCFFGK